MTEYAGAGAITWIPMQTTGLRLTSVDIGRVVRPRPHQPGMPAVHPAVTNSAPLHQTGTNHYRSQGERLE